MLRGILRHSWLKNQILTMDAGYVIQMRGRPSLHEEREAFERKIRPGGEFESRLGEARKLVREMVDGFSPAQLVDSGPLAGLSPEARAAVKSVVHREYLSRTMIEKCVGPAAAACDALEDALRKFSDDWFRQPYPGAVVIRKRFEELQQRARALSESLGDLPEGIVLP
jgi:hypothetical protein